MYEINLWSAGVWTLPFDYEPQGQKFLDIIAIANGEGREGEILLPDSRSAIAPLSLSGECGRWSG